MKLQQGQTWHHGAEYIRLVKLERLQVEYKIMTDLLTKEGIHHHATKKDFCRLIKKAQLLPASSRNEETPTAPAVDKIETVNSTDADQ